MSEYAIRALDATTWDAFARLVESTTGVGSAVAGARGPPREKAGPEGESAAPEGACCAR